MVADYQLAWFANMLGVLIFVLIILYHYVTPRLGQRAKAINAQNDRAASLVDEEIPPYKTFALEAYIAQQLTEANANYLQEAGLNLYMQRCAAVRSSFQASFQASPWQASSIRTGLVCKKIGVMPQYTVKGERIACTLLEVLDNHVVAYQDPETWYKMSKVGKKEGFKRLGRLVIGVDSRDPQIFTSAYLGLFERAGVLPKNKIASFAVTPDARLTPGTRLYANHFTVGQHVDIWGYTVDHGFQGVMVRWGFKGMPATHGVTKTHRRPGSIGTSGDACVKPGKKMPGHMGSEWRPLRAQEIVRINTTKQVIYIRGASVPGEVGALVYVRDCGLLHKRVQNPPFPTYFPSEDHNLAEEQFVDSLFRYDQPTIEFEIDKDDAKARRRKGASGIGHSCLARFKGSLVLVEHDGNDYAPSTLNVITAAARLGDVSCFLIGERCHGVADKLAGVKSVKTIYTCESALFKGFLPELITPMVVDCHQKHAFDAILAASGCFGKAVVPRVAATLNVGCASDVMDIKSPDTFVRPMYAGNAICTVQLLDSVKALTIRTTAFASASHVDGSAKVTRVAPPEKDVSDRVQFVEQQLSKSERPQLSSAKKVISGGRGLKNKDNFKILYDLADKLGAAVGASRAAVDAGFCNNDMQVGQTGQIVAPDLYIAVGISGAIQHLAGMKDSKTIVAINKDPDAPIFQVADHGLVADLFQAVPELTQKIE